MGESPGEAGQLAYNDTFCVHIQTKFDWAILELERKSKSGKAMYL